MKRHEGSGKMKSRGLGAVTFIGCLIAFLIVLTILESNSRASAILSLQLSFNSYEPLSTVEGSNTQIQQGKESNVLLVPNKENQNFENSSSDDTGETNLPIRLTEDLNLSEPTTAKDSNQLPLNSEEKQNLNDLNLDSNEDNTLPVKLTENTNQNESIGKSTEDPAQNETVNENEILTERIEEVPETDNKDRGTELTEISNSSLDQEEKSDAIIQQPVDSDKQTGENESNTDNDVMHPLPDSTESHEQDQKIEDNQNQKQSKLVCDFNHPRADTCSMEGDVRVLGSYYSTIFLVSPSDVPQDQRNTHESKLRPYARKWEQPTMQMIKELTIKQLYGPDHVPPCTVQHDVPVVVFSTGGFVGNVFHDFTDILIPLFMAANQYNGEVKLAVTDMSWWWIFKYLPMIKQLSNYPIINLDTDKSVHCFPSAQIGVKSHKPLGIDPSQAPNNYTIQDFRAFMRKSFGLKRSHTEKINMKSGRKPRLLILIRRGTRAFENEKQLVQMARRVGFKVITADPDKTRDFPKFAHVVNSCDVLLGIHGAGLANMLYLPTNATLIQILPWGDLGFVGRHDYGLPLPDMGLNYVEYEITVEESTLIYKYPRDHAVFTNPQEIHNQGWNTMYRIYLTEQNIMLNVDRFRGVLIDVFKSLVQ